jgi:hypothetical protein
MTTPGGSSGRSAASYRGFSSWAGGTDFTVSLAFESEHATNPVTVMTSALAMAMNARENMERSYHPDVHLTVMFATRVLDGQTAIVTGGGTGIGLAIARALGRMGATVAIASRHTENTERGVAEITEDGAQAFPIQVDVRDPAAVDAMVESVVARTGRLDILINNAAGNFICRAEDLSPNGWNAVIGIVLNGSFYCSRAAGRAR